MGAASAAFLAELGHHVSLVERDPDRRSVFEAGQVPFREPLLAEHWRALLERGVLRMASAVGDVLPCDQVWIAVGTPSLPDGRADLSQVESVVSDLEGTPGGICVMRSTVPPGTGTSLSTRLAKHGWGYVAHPEFLREGLALDDMERPSRLVIGSSDHELSESVKAVYGEQVQVPVVLTTVASAELAKLASNAFLAARVSFINEMALLSDAVGADVRVVAQVMGMDERIGPRFLEAGIGYGGSCFPKDTRALGSLGEDLGVPLTILRSVIEVNSRMQRVLIRRVRQALGGSFSGASIAVWGLTFKPGTDDVRESPSLTVVNSLLAEHANVIVHDPAAGVLPWGAQVPRAKEPEESLIGAQAVLVLTAWPAYQRVVPAEVVPSMQMPRIVADGRGALRADDWRHAGATVIGIGTGQPVGERVREATPFRAEALGA